MACNVAAGKEMNTERIKKKQKANEEIIIKETEIRIRRVILCGSSSTNCGTLMANGWLPAMLLICMLSTNKFIHTGLINHGQFLWSGLRMQFPYLRLFCYFSDGKWLMQCALRRHLDRRSCSARNCEEMVEFVDIPFT